MCYDGYMSNRVVGANGEDIAVEYLRGIGYKIISRNDVSYGVEADIVAKDGKQVVIVEVKTKSGIGFGLPQEMVTPHKQGQLIRYAKGYIAEKGWMDIRIDVIAIINNARRLKIEHLRNVIEVKE